MAVEPVVTPASPDDFGDTIALLDDEFVHGKGRSISLARRFPQVYCLDNISNMYVVKEAGEIAACAVTRRCQWLTAEETWGFAMIGGVCTVPHLRGHGLASAILRYICARLDEAGMAFAVLWTSIPMFYARLGWQSSDRGLFGKLVSGPPHCRQVLAVQRRSDVVGNASDLAAMRTRCLQTGFLRQMADYSVVPLPAETTECFIAHDDFEKVAYAIVGCAHETAYIYEVIGSPVAYSALLSAITEAYATVYINDVMGSPFTRWLDAHCSVTWSPQALALWQVFSPHLAMYTVGQIHIPYLDRI